MSDPTKLGYKYFIMYVEDCTPKLICFNSKSTADAWAIRFLCENQGIVGYTIDLMFFGQIDFADDIISLEADGSTLPTTKDTIRYDYHRR